MILQVLVFLLAFLINQTPSSNASLRSDGEFALSEFKFSSFTSTSCDDDDLLICMGSVTIKDGYLSLTPEPEEDPSPTYKYSRVLYKLPVFAWPRATISTTFTINMNTFPSSNTPADGITFIMAPDSSPPPPNSWGEYLGLMNSTLDAAGNVVGQLAVELDIYKNSYDIDDNHVGIDTTSVNSLVAMPVSTRLSTGNNITVRIDYNPIGEILAVSLAPVNEELSTVLSHSIKLSDTVPRSIYVGFTAATGGQIATHRILDWDFSSLSTVNSLGTTDATNVGRDVWNIYNNE